MSRTLVVLGVGAALGVLALAGCGGGGSSHAPSSDEPSASTAANSTPTAAAASPAAVRRTLSAVDACALLRKSGVRLAEVERTRPHRCEAKIDDFPVSVILGVPFGPDDRTSDARVDLDGLVGYRSSTSQQVVITVGATYGIAVTDRGDLPAAVAHALSQNPDDFDIAPDRSTYAACELLGHAVADSDKLLDARGTTSADRGLDMCSVQGEAGDGLLNAALQNSDAGIDQAAAAASSQSGVFDLVGHHAYTQSLGASGCVVQVLIGSRPDSADVPPYTYAGFTGSSCGRARSAAAAAMRGLPSSPPAPEVPLGRLLTRVS